jgi:competence protein ComEC
MNVHHRGKRDNKRPALWAAVLYAGGICLGYLMQPPMELLAVGAFLLGGCSMWCGRGRFSIPWSSFFLGAALLLAACLHYEVGTRLVPGHHLAHGSVSTRQAIVDGRVIADSQKKDDRTTCFIQATAIDTGDGRVPATGRVMVSIKKLGKELHQGEVVRLCGRLRAPDGARNPGEFDYREYLRRRGVWAVLTTTADGVEMVVWGPRGWLGWLAGQARRHLNACIDRTLQGSPSALLRGLLLGQRGDVPDEVTAAFSDAGVIHVLAVSGLHVGLIVAIFYALFCAMRWPQPAATLLTLAVVALYMVVVDFRPSVVRATIMAATVMVGRLLERDADLLNTIPFAGLVILIWNPSFLFDLGFQLSFAATLSIVYLHGRLSNLCCAFVSTTSPKWLRWTAAGFTVSLAAQLGTLPIVAYHFQKIPVISLVANLVVVPLVGLAVALGFTAALLFPLSAYLSELYASANWLVLNVLIGLVSWAASLPVACIRVSQPALGWIAIYYLFLLLGVNMKRSRAAARAFLFGGLILLNVWVWGTALGGGGRLKVVFFDVGQGDAALVSFPNGRRMLVDGGERTLRNDCGERILCPYFRRAGIQRLDVMVLTHADNDHVGGLPTVLETIPVELVLGPGARHLSATYLRFLSLATQSGRTYQRVRSGDRLLIDENVTVMILHPTDRFVSWDGKAPQGLNNGSVVLHLAYGRISLLLTGDIEEEAERHLVNAGRLAPASCLKVPHHGSISSSSEEFLMAVRPTLAVISVGRENRFGHPHEQVLDRYRRQGVCVLRTDRDGAVLLETDGRNLWVETTVTDQLIRFSSSQAAASAAGQHFSLDLPIIKDY